MSMTADKYWVNFLGHSCYILDNVISGTLLFTTVEWTRQVLVLRCK